MSSKTKATVRAKPEMVPKLRFPEFRGAEGWTAEKLGSRAKKVGSGITPTGGEKNYKQSGRPFVRSQNIGWGILLLDDVAFIDEETHNSFCSTQIDDSDVLLNITGASIGRSAIADSRIEGGNVNQHVCIVRVKPGELSPYFLNQYLISHDGQKQIDSFQAGGNRQGLNFEQIRSFLIPLPADFTEQQKIAEFLTSVDELMAAQARKVDALKAHKKGLMQQLFPREGETQPRLRFPEFQNAGEWEHRKAGTLFSNRVTKGEQGLPIYSVTMHDGMVKRDSFDRNFYDIEDAAGNKKVCKDDIAYNMMRMWQGALGVAPEDCLVSPAYIVLAPIKDALPVFFQYLFKLPATLLLLTSHSRGLTKDRLRLYYDDFARIPLRCPAPPEQQRIASCLSSLDALITAETQKLEALKTHKKGLMQQLFPSAEDVDA